MSFFLQIEFQDKRRGDLRVGQVDIEKEIEALKKKIKILERQSLCLPGKCQIQFGKLLNRLMFCLYENSY